MSIRHDPGGAVWRRWDLHFHTPSSYDYKDKSVTNSEIISGLQSAGLSVVAITDHHTIDVDRIQELQNLAGERLTVLPGIELRTQLGGSESVHIIGIFSEQCQLGDVWQKLQVNLHLTKADLRSTSDDEVFVTFEDAARWIHDLGGIMSVHAGNKSNSFENIRNTEQFKQYFKTEYLRRLIDIVEVGRVEDQEKYRDIVFKKVGVDRPIVLCSDNHNIKTYGARASLWIKGDATFLGLKQTLIEPRQRVFIGEEPPQVQRVRENPTKYISSIEMRKAPGSLLSESWFDQSIPLNPGLVAVIGNKGSGKSALADIIGLLGDCRTYDHFSFLNDKKFRDKRQVQPKAAHFVARLNWASGGQSLERYLNVPSVAGAVEYVKYIPQMYLERICMDYENGEKTEFTGELKNAIFSHVPEADRLESADLDELLNLKTRETERELNQKRTELQALNKRIVASQERASAGHRKNLTEKLAERQRALEAEDKLKPLEVQAPETKPEDQPAYDLLRSQIDELELGVKSLAEQIEDAKRKQASSTKGLAAISRVKQRVSNFVASVSKLTEELSEDLEGLEIEAAKIITVSTDFTQLDEKVANLQQQLDDAKTSLDLENDKSLVRKRAEDLVNVEKLRARLDEPQRVYEKYVQELNAHLSRRAEIVGTTTQPESLEYYIGAIASLDKIPEQLEELYCLRKALIDEIYSTIVALATEYKAAYNGVQHFIDSNRIAKKKGLQFNVTLKDKSFALGFMDFIDATRKGSFRGRESGIEQLNKIINQVDLQTETGLLALLNEVNRLLWTDEDKQADFSYVKNQIRQDKTVDELYDYIYGLKYIEADYTLTWDGKPLEQLSPGERGTLLLIFYLLVDKNDVPLIIDQPEENLDNQTVFDTLVESIREAKQRRQVIIVTHNPNLAVVCDADEVVHASLDKVNGNRVWYSSGALENPAITQLVVDVLEGTRDAFDVRDAKYRLAERWKILLGKSDAISNGNEK